MPGISTRFFATPEKLRQLVEEVARDYHLHVVTMRYRPFEAKEVAVDEIAPCFSQSSLFRRWAFTVDPQIVPESPNGARFPLLIFAPLGLRVSLFSRLNHADKIELRPHDGRFTPRHQQAGRIEARKRAKAQKGKRFEAANDSAAKGEGGTQIRACRKSIRRRIFRTPQLWAAPTFKRNAKTNQADPALRGAPV
jgi:hypothetical protein